MLTSVTPIKLSELNQLIQDAIDGSFRNQRYGVLAETLGISLYPNKNSCYLTLVEKCDQSETIRASIKAKIWGSFYKCIGLFEETTGQAFKNNIQVLVYVRVNYHPQYGLSLDIEEIDCNYTIGKLALSRQAVLQKLVTDNPEHIFELNGEYLTFNKNLSLPPVIQRIALISSANADGYTDFLHELYTNAHGYTFDVDEYLAPVQGIEAHKELYNQLVRIYESGIPYDAVVMVRGGGSQLDFRSFDSYLLARAVARFPIPIITGIGHEKDESVCDLMAKLKTKTPTKAAASIIGINRFFEEKLLQLQKQVIIKTNEITISQELVLNALQNNLLAVTKETLHKQHKYLQAQINNTIYNAGQRLQTERMHLQSVKFNLHCNSDTRLRTESFKLLQLKSSLTLLDPQNILKRGYALVYQNGKVVNDVEGIKSGSVINTRFYNGEIESKVLPKDNSYDQ